MHKISWNNPILRKTSWNLSTIKIRISTYFSSFYDSLNSLSHGFQEFKTMPIKLAPTISN